MGWLFDRAGQAEHARYARDLYEDRGMQVINRTFGLWVLAGLALPFGLGYLIDGTLVGAALWGGPVRIFALHHESWHHNHHAFPRSAQHGLRWWAVDPTAWLIGAMKRVRLAWNVQITPERQRAKLKSS